MMTMKCPECGLINPDSALRCDCGFDFQSQSTKESYVEFIPKYAGFWFRFGALFVDSFFTVITYGGIAILISRSTSIIIKPNTLVYILFLIYSWIYWAGMESSSKQAMIGKMARKIKVTDLNGKRISFRRASGRFLGKLLSNATTLIGYLMAAFTIKKQALHDILTGCFFVENR